MSVKTLLCQDCGREVIFSTEAQHFMMEQEHSGFNSKGKGVSL